MIFKDGEQSWSIYNYDAVIYINTFNSKYWIASLINLTGKLINSNWISLPDLNSKLFVENSIIFVNDKYVFGLQKYQYNTYQTILIHDKVNLNIKKMLLWTKWDNMKGFQYLSESKESKFIFKYMTDIHLFSFDSELNFTPTSFSIKNYEIFHAYDTFNIAPLFINKNNTNSNIGYLITIYDSFYNHSFFKLSDNNTSNVTLNFVSLIFYFQLF